MGFIKGGIDWGAESAGYALGLVEAFVRPGRDVLARRVAQGVVGMLLSERGAMERDGLVRRDGWDPARARHQENMPPRHEEKSRTRADTKEQWACVHEGQRLGARGKRGFNGLSASLARLR